MSKLFQIQLSNGNIYITREDSIEEFYKSKVYKFKKGCVVKSVVTQNGQAKVQMLDLSKNALFELPFFIQSNCINEIFIIRKRSQLEEHYLKVTSGIVIVKE